MKYDEYIFICSGCCDGVCLQLPRHIGLRLSAPPLSRGYCSDVSFYLLIFQYSVWLLSNICYK